MEQEVPAPWNVPPFDWHWVCEVTTQCPLGRQHAPICGWGQDVLEQEVPAPWKVPPLAWQWVWEVTTQEPLGRQHAPVVGG